MKQHSHLYMGYPSSHHGTLQKHSSAGSPYYEHSGA